MAEYRAYLAPLRRIKWYVHPKPPFGGPKAVLAYLARYTHRVAIANSRLGRQHAAIVAPCCRAWQTAK
jgi:hypothetical protein